MSESVTQRSRDESFARVNLSDRQREVYELVKRHGPGTAREIFRDSETGMLYSSFQPRLTKELREKGCVMALGRKTCSVSGERVTEWIAV